MWRRAHVDHAFAFEPVDGVGDGQLVGLRVVRVHRHLVAERGHDAPRFGLEVGVAAGEVDRRQARDVDSRRRVDDDRGAASRYQRHGRRARQCGELARPGVGGVHDGAGIRGERSRPDSVPFETAASLAARVEVSEPTVGRFCRSLGYSSFKDHLKREVDEVSLDLPRGRTVGVVGESGCGKSTLARLALRLIEATSGTVEFDGIDLGTQSPAALRLLRRRMQMVFQDPYSAIDPRYSVTRAVLEPFEVQKGEAPGTVSGTGGRATTRRVNRTRVEALLEQAGLGRAMADSYPHQLSGGRRQRVGIAPMVVMYLGRVVEILPAGDAPSRHHYTRALMVSNFEPDPAWRRVVVLLEGEMPSPFDMPPGCAFAARCPAATSECRDARPPLESDAAGRAVACFHPLERDERIGGTGAQVP